MDDSISGWINDVALQHLEGNAAGALTQVWKDIYRAFHQWKLEHGDRNPKGGRGLLSDLVGKPDPFESAEPWQCSDDLWPSPVALAIRLHLTSYAPFAEITNREGVSKVMALLIALFTDKSSQADLLAAHDIGLRHAEYMAGTISGRANERAKQNKNLANGRLEGQKSQKEYAAETWRLVAERHKQFLKRPDYAGWKPGARATYLAGLMQADPDNNEPLKGRHQTNGQPYKASGIQKRLAKMG